jgi:protein kinase-like protein
MSPDEATLVALSVCRAIAAVHAAGLVHRDVKAGNVMRESGGRIVLMDFGAGRDAAELASLRTAEAAGTPLYMAPEVLGGGRASVMSDVYSIGVLMFYLVTGRYPVEGRTIADVAIAHSLGQRMLLHDCRPDLPPEFVRVVERAISPAPRDRYQSVGAMIGDLTAIGQGAPALADVQPAPVHAASDAAVRRFVRYAYGIAAAAGAVWFLGFVNWTVFNHTLGRAGPFAHESALDWAASGVQSLVPYTVYGAVIALAWYGLTSLVRVMSRLSRTWAGWMRRLGGGIGALGARVRLNDVEVAAQALFAAQVLALTTFVWIFRNLLLAVATFISEATPDQVRALRPENIDTHGVYGLTLTVLILAMAAAWRRILRWRARTDPARGRGATIAGAVLIAAAVLLLTAPYRLMWHNNQFERADFGSMPCFILGDTPDEFLLYCPGGPVPRTRTVSRADPQLKRLHVSDSIYRWPIAR